MPFGYNKNKSCLSRLVRPVVWCANYFDKSLYDIGNLCLPILIGILVNFTTSEYKEYIFIAIALCLFFAILCLVKSHKDKDGLLSSKKNFEDINEKLVSINKELLEQIETIKGDFRLLNRQSIENNLKIINNTVGCNSHHRLSLYFELNGSFVILGRFSDNPKLSIINTTKFPLDKGALTKSWESGYFEDFECPMFSKKDSNRYYSYQKKVYEYSKRKIEGLNMKSCNYIGFRINDNGIPVGVILFESEKSDLSPKKQLIDETCSAHHDILAKLIQTGKTYTHIINPGGLEDSPENEFLQLMGGKNV